MWDGPPTITAGNGLTSMYLRLQERRPEQLVIEWGMSMPEFEHPHILLATLGGKPEIVTITLDLLLQQHFPDSPVLASALYTGS